MEVSGNWPLQMITNGGFTYHEPIKMWILIHKNENLTYHFPNYPFDPENSYVFLKGRVDTHVLFSYPHPCHHSQILDL